MGPVAAIKTLDIMERELGLEYDNQDRRKDTQWLETTFKRKGVPIDISGIASLSSFSFRAKDPLVCKTFIAQEMLKKGFLASTAVYVSISHSDDIVDLYLTALGEVFDAIAGCENSTELLALLDVPVCHDGFRRLN